MLSSGTDTTRVYLVASPYQQFSPHSELRLVVGVAIWAGGTVMSDMGLEEPDADAVEQHRNAIPEADDDATVAVTQPPLEANEADAAEQEQELDAADDEYR
jgi:hypothetical protein